MSQAHDPEKLKSKLRAFAKDFPFFNLVGFELIDFGPGWSECKVQLRPDLANPNGFVHGGVVATLIDASITQAMLMTDAYQQIRDTKGLMTTVDLRVKYLRPLRSGSMVCRADIPHLGKRVVHASAEVKNDDGKPIATGDSILLLTLGKG